MGFAQEGIPGKCSTESTTNLPTPRLPGEAGHLQTLTQGDTGQGPHSVGEAAAPKPPPPATATSCRTHGPQLPQGLGEARGRGVNTPVSALLKPIPQYLELLLSSVIVQHQLFRLLAANDGLSSWSSLAPLKR